MLPPGYWDRFELTEPGVQIYLCRKAFLATTQVPRNANTVTKTAVGMLELLPSVLLNLASGPQIAVTNTATHMAVIASDPHTSGMSRSDHRGRSWTTPEGSCDIVDISFTPFRNPILTQKRLAAIRAAPDRNSVESARMGAAEGRRGAAPASGTPKDTVLV
jgi:hypothetical protein